MTFRCPNLDCRAAASKQECVNWGKSIFKCLVCDQHYLWDDTKRFKVAIIPNEFRGGGMPKPFVNICNPGTYFKEGVEFSLYYDPPQCKSKVKRKPHHKRLTRCRRGAIKEGYCAFCHPTDDAEYLLKIWNELAAECFKREFEYKQREQARRELNEFMLTT